MLNMPKVQMNGGSWQRPLLLTEQTHLGRRLTKPVVAYLFS